MQGNDQADNGTIALYAFVKEAILETLKAIQSAQKDKNVGFLVAPSITGNAKIDPSYGVAHHDGRMFTSMTFDLAVTAKVGTTARAETGASGDMFGIESSRLGVSVKGSKDGQV